MNSVPINRVVPSTKKLRSYIKPILDKHGVTVLKSKTRRHGGYYPMIPQEIKSRQWDYKFRMIDYTLEADDPAKIDQAIKSIKVMIGLLGFPYNPPRHNVWNSGALKQSYTFFAYMEN